MDQTGILAISGFCVLVYLSLDSDEPIVKEEERKIPITAWTGFWNPTTPAKSTIVNLMEPDTPVHDRQFFQHLDTPMKIAQDLNAEMVKTYGTGVTLHELKDRFKDEDYSDHQVRQIHQELGQELPVKINLYNQFVQETDTTAVRPEPEQKEVYTTRAIAEAIRESNYGAPDSGLKMRQIPASAVARSLAQDFRMLGGPAIASVMRSDFADTEGNVATWWRLPYQWRNTKTMGGQLELYNKLEAFEKSEFKRLYEDTGVVTPEMLKLPFLRRMHTIRRAIEKYVHPQPMYEGIQEGDFSRFGYLR